MKFSPMLASAVKPERFEQDIKFPVYGSPKLDGFRCFVKDGVGFTRSLKEVRNKFVQKIFSENQVFNDLDGELIVGDPTDEMVFRNTSSGVTRYEGEPEFRFFVFDWIGDLKLTFQNRRAVYESREDPRIVHVPQTWITDLDELRAVIDVNLEAGYEGTMLRSPDGYYKAGRSTVREQMLLKLKPIEQDEAVIEGFEEQMHNANEATTNALGYTERASLKENLVPKDTLGAVIVRHPKFGTFNVGSGFNDAERKEIWNNRPYYMGMTITFAYQMQGGYDKPRFPIFKGFRHQDDL